MKTTRIPRVIPYLLSGLCACAGTPANGPTTSSVSTEAAPGSGTLYARDGSVVSPGTASGRAPSEPMREIGAGEGSRVYLLELYQRSMDEKNALSFQVDGLRGALEEERQIGAAAADELERVRAELAQVTLERDGLRTQALELAARVTSAQIARLEAEKAWLQLKIDANRADAAGAKRGGQSGAQRNNGGGHQ